MSHSDQIKVSPGILDWGRESLKQEAESLLAAADRLDQRFAEAVTTILSCRGKLVLTGLGKSGHIASKMSATFASTGTPAFFLHPSEALHGDLGMLSESDCLLAVAYGGETTEVIDVAKYARRLTIPVIAITGKVNSSLAKLATTVVDGSVERETCPHNLAPTTSSLLALALGDALAVALMRARGFSMDQFAAYHPAGSLGRKLALVSDFVRRDGQFMVSERVDFDAILEAITSQNHGIVGVCDDSGMPTTPKHVGLIFSATINYCQTLEEKS